MFHIKERGTYYKMSSRLTSLWLQDEGAWTQVWEYVAYMACGPEGRGHLGGHEGRSPWWS